ncbi:MAG: prepilin-type N-terminal cleavage/methylation domain-containing protein [Thermoguttaceae bacterium]
MQRRSGFTLVEVSVACVLTAFLAVVLSTTWRLLMPSTADLIVWGQLFQEMQIAVATLSRDVGGALPDNGYAGAKQQGRLLACRKDPVYGHLQLCFDGVYPYGAGSQGTAADGAQADWSGNSDTVIDYSVDGSFRLIRTNTATVAQFTVATNVYGLDASGNQIPGISITDNGTYLTIVLTFSSVVKMTNKTLSRTCTLIVNKTP